MLLIVWNKVSNINYHTDGDNQISNIISIKISNVKYRMEQDIKSQISYRSKHQCVKYQMLKILLLVNCALFLNI